MTRRTWVKIFADKWLRGSIREELPEVRGVFIDVLTLAADSAYGDDGMVSIVPGLGFSDHQIAEILNLNLKQWQNIKQRLIDTDRITANGDNELQVTKWKKYQSEYARQAKYRRRLLLKVTTTSASKGDQEKREERREKKDKRIKKEDISLVFAYWQKTFDHSRAKLTQDRKTKIAARLRDYSLDDLKRTIDGCKASSYHQGENDQGKVYDSIELLFRNGDKVESFWQYTKNSVMSDTKVQLSKACAELGKLAGKKRILKWLLILPENYHSRLSQFLDRAYRQGHSYSEAKDEWRKQKE